MTIGVADPNCRGVTDPSGRRRYDKDARGRIEVPRSVGMGILASGHRDAHLFHVVTGGIGGTLQDEYEAWLAEQPGHVPYATWYREHKETAQEATGA